ncbi:MAG: hypothetical protein Q4Q17_05955, partial [Tissierellia bacterium]|nr:hypothetical protein [Tissierellia bacterium]
MLDKILNELKPYMAQEQSNLLYFALIALFVMALHVVFTRYKFVKYLPGIILIIYGILILVNNGY